VFNDVTPADSSDWTTPAIFDDGFNTFTLSNAVRYLGSATPVVSLISPNNGTIYGGTTVVFTGSNFDAGVPSVVIDGVSCVVTQVNSTFFTCVTAPRLFLPTQNSFVVKFGTQNALLNDEFLYTMKWSDSRTWGTDLPPVEGDLVYVPKGMTLYVDQTTPRLDGIIV
jgi:hypothetical protein